MAGDADPLAILLKFGFLAVLYLFLLFIARSALRDLRRDEEPPAAAAARSAQDGRPAAPLDGHRIDFNPRLEVIAGKGHQPGQEFDVRAGARLGRAQTSEVSLDDSYASAAHARVYPRDGAMFIEDLGSTNGTYVNGRELTRPLRLAEGDTVRIGDTELRYRE